MKTLATLILVSLGLIATGWYVIYIQDQLDLAHKRMDGMDMARTLEISYLESEIRKLKRDRAFEEFDEFDEALEDNQ
jgi:hypothetical protein